MFLKMLFHSLARRKRRKLLAVVSVWLGAGLVVAMIILSLSVGDSLNREMKALGANIRVEPQNAALRVSVGGTDLSPSQPAYLQEQDAIRLRTIFWRNNILGMVPQLTVHGQVNQKKDVQVTGMWIEYTLLAEKEEPFVTGAKHLYPYWNVSGRWPVESDSTPECLIGETLARELGVGSGSQIDLQVSEEKISFLIAGIVSSGGWEDMAVIAPLKTVQALSRHPGLISAIDVSALTTPENKLAEKYSQNPSLLTPVEYERWYCTPYPGSIAAEIQDNIPGAAARVVRRVSETQGAVFSRIKGLLGFLAALTFLVCCLSLIGIFISAVLERRQEIAILQAIGAEPQDVIALFLAEGTIIGIAGGVLAWITGLAIAQWLGHIIFSVHTDVQTGGFLIFAIFVSILTMWTGHIWPLWQAMRQDIVKVIHGN